MNQNGLILSAVGFPGVSVGIRTMRETWINNRNEVVEDDSHKKEKKAKRIGK
jgi:hypothetical protein